MSATDFPVATKREKYEWNTIVAERCTMINWEPVCVCVCCEKQEIFSSSPTSNEHGLFLGSMLSTSQMPKRDFKSTPFLSKKTLFRVYVPSVSI
jgi:hypothetical protein